MSVKSRARRRQKATGEKYMIALLHVKAECGKCQKGRPCPGCKVQPCADCDLVQSIIEMSEPKKAFSYDFERNK